MTGWRKLFFSPEPAEIGIISGPWTLCFSGGLFIYLFACLFWVLSPSLAVCSQDSRRVRPQQCRAEQRDSRRLWRKPYLVKLFVAVTQRDRPAINSTGGGTEINKTSSKMIMYNSKLSH